MKNFVSALNLLVPGLLVTIAFTGCGSVNSTSPTVAAATPTPPPITSSPSPTPSPTATPTPTQTPTAPGTFVFEGSKTTDRPVTGFRLNADGTMTVLANSPFPSSTALAVSGNFLIAAQDGMAVSYRIDPGTGNLTTASSRDVPAIVALAADGKNVYAAGSLNPASSGTGIYGFSISASGTLTPLPGSPYFFSVACTDICDSPLALTLNDNFVFEAGAQGHGSGSVTAYPRAADGTLGTPHTAFDPETLTKAAIQPSGGRFAYTANGLELSDFMINADGSVATIGSPQFPNAADVAIDATGRFLLMLDSGGAVHVLTIDPATGGTSQIGTSEAAGNGATAMSMDPSNQFVMVLQSATPPQNANQITVFTFDEASGAMKKLKSYPAGSEPTFTVVAKTQ